MSAEQPQTSNLTSLSLRLRTRCVAPQSSGAPSGSQDGCLLSRPLPEDCEQGPSPACDRGLRGLSDIPPPLANTHTLHLVLNVSQRPNSIRCDSASSAVQNSLDEEPAFQRIIHFPGVGEESN